MNIAAIARMALLVVAATSKVTSHISSRQKRYLVYPAPGSKVQVIVGTGVPIPLEKHAVTMGWVLKAKYLLPTNSTEYTDSYVTFQKRSVAATTSRYDLYRAFEMAANRFGAGGKECTLRSICEASRIPLGGSGLLGRIFRILLLPSTTDETPTLRSDSDYLAAEKLGAEGADCKVLYPSCAVALVDLLTVLI